MSTAILLEHKFQNFCYHTRILLLQRLNTEPNGENFIILTTTLSQKIYKLGIT